MSNSDVIVREILMSNQTGHRILKWPIIFSARVGCYSVGHKILRKYDGTQNSQFGCPVTLTNLWECGILLVTELH